MSGLNKVIIRRYADRNLNNAEAGQEFVLPINPEQYSQNYKVNYNTRSGSGQHGAEGRYKGTAPEELRLEFIFDGTETVQGYAQAGKTVREQIEAFVNFVYRPNGKIHRPKFLQINWGSFLVFPCFLTNLDINYTLFEENGDPLRAKLNCTFKKYTPREEAERATRNSSSDLTHRRLIQPGERLDLITNQIYSNPKYVLEVAKANNLTSFRNLKSLIGREVQFPPLQKTEVQK